jgi:hypothetical protein
MHDAKRDSHEVVMHPSFPRSAWRNGRIGVWRRRSVLSRQRAASGIQPKVSARLLVPALPSGRVFTLRKTVRFDP